MRIRDRLATPLGAATAGAIAATTIFFAGMYAARATPGGETRRTLTYTGTLTGRTGPQTLTFTFRKGAATVCAPSATATPDATTGALSVEVPLTDCPTSLFDGSDVTYEVTVGGTALSPSQPISPVPYAFYADRVGTPDCPVGYDRFSEASAPAGAILCRKGNDEIVRVGSGASAFWIDRYLASVWSGPGGTGTQFTSATASTVAYDGSWTTPSYAASVRGVQSTGDLAWRQAEALCRLSGKRLPTALEWLEAARGTPGLGTDFRVRPDECPGARGLAYATGSTPQCVSAWGMEQAVGYRWQFGTGHGFGSSGYPPLADIFASRSNPIQQAAYFRQSCPSCDLTPPLVDPIYGLRCVMPR